VDSWLLTVAIGTLTFTLGVAGFFIQKWIQAVDETLENLSKETSSNGKKIAAIETVLLYQPESIAHAVKRELASNAGTDSRRLHTIEEDIRLIKLIHVNRLVPLVDEQKKIYGKIILIEEKISDQDGKMVKLFEVIKTVALRDRK